MIIMDRLLSPVLPHADSPSSSVKAMFFGGVALEEHLKGGFFCRRVLS